MLAYAHVDIVQHTASLQCHRDATRSTTILRVSNLGGSGNFATELRLRAVILDY